MQKEIRAIRAQELEKQRKEDEEKEKEEQNSRFARPSSNSSLSSVSNSTTKVIKNKNKKFNLKITAVRNKLNFFYSFYFSSVFTQLHQLTRIVMKIIILLRVIIFWIKIIQEN